MSNTARERYGVANKKAAGCILDSGQPVFMRDCQMLPISYAYRSFIYISIVSGIVINYQCNGEAGCETLHACSLQFSVGAKKKGIRIVQGLKSHELSGFFLFEIDLVPLAFKVIKFPVGLFDDLQTIKSCFSFFVNIFSIFYQIYCPGAAEDTPTH